GAGPMEKSLKRQVKKLGLDERVMFLGCLPHDELFQYYSVADGLVLASSREGWANVLLESMACGTPVVATAVSGTIDIVKAPAAGQLISDRSALGIATAIRTLMKNYPDRTETRKYAEKFSWDETTEQQRLLFKELVNQSSETVLVS
ncbi:MAG TPA: glycosyltransferase, partial [Gammaproteobacteria bacterium]|nr:glycosyltransferase [Gammaproteobacteria bacterium]